MDLPKWNQGWWRGLKVRVPWSRSRCAMRKRPMPERRVSPDRSTMRPSERAPRSTAGRPVPSPSIGNFVACSRHQPLLRRRAWQPREAPEQPVAGGSSELERKMWTAAVVSLGMLFEVVATSGSGISIDSFHLARRLCSKACWPCSWSRSGLRCVRCVRGGAVAPRHPYYSPISSV